LGQIAEVTKGKELIVIEQVEKRYGKDRVLWIDQWKLRAGQSVGIQGSNGSGKSTLLRILAGVSTHRGRVHRFCPRNKCRFGYLPQSGGLYSELSLRENLSLRRQLYGLPESPLQENWYVKDLDLERFLTKRISQLSGGYQRLACIAATFHVEPHWVFLDEPFSGVDSKRTQILKARLVEAANQLELFVLTAPSPEDMIATSETVSITEGHLS
jgi:ABC-type multidrug transport system ATPase subunit